MNDHFDGATLMREDEGMTHLKNQRFWDRIAARYAARPLKNVPAYEAMLAECMDVTEWILDIIYKITRYTNRETR